MNKDKDQLVSIGVIHKVYRGKLTWFVCKTNENGDWELPRTTVRRGESSVRAILRLTVEQALMRNRVLEEAYRTTAVVKTNGRAVTQKQIYYLMVQKEAGETLGFAGFHWLEYSKAIKKLASKKDQVALKNARDVLKELEKKAKVKK